MSDPNPIRSEIEQILLSHPRTRFAKVLRGMKDRLDDHQMSQKAHTEGQPIRADGIAAVRRIVSLTLKDELVTAPSQAEEQSNLYRELLNYPRSPELQQHIVTRLTQLQAIGPNVRMTPLGESRLGANDQPNAARQQPKCEKCDIEHAGECY
ncbi:hypothetical protein [Mycolicibacterium holsaticum]|uniref:Uncharacterized protein n=1 Tax=Mycolicibacterium holsaticum TaxID=152142 RepID=A0A1E3RK82_9MYCO|nr:hypothetical protein [Mycolicibacterium holsaticum]ODQ90264.1 hypothetical protein BHQ17_17530 [Mycolicibacterium holsaticum]